MTIKHGHTKSDVKRVINDDGALWAINKKIDVDDKLRDNRINQCSKAK